MGVPLHCMQLRAPWRGETEGGRVTWRRRFHRPSRLGPEERVWLVIEGFCLGADVFLDAQPLGRLDVAATRFEITECLRDTSDLAIQWRLMPPSAADSLMLGVDPPGVATIEIGLRLPGETLG